MYIEWVGGPEDGKVFDAPDGTTNIRIVLHTKMVRPDEVKFDPDASVPLNIITIPVERYKTRFVVRYPKEQEWDS